MLIASPLIAASSSDLEEIVVTAQKREQNVQDVGISISAISGERLASLGKTDSVQIAAITPGVSISGSSGNQTSQFSIRGVTQNDFSDHVESPNAVYIDEGYVGFMQAQLFGMFDLDRVEILKGPQGTLFGRNATGGLVNYITRKPSKEFDGYVDFTYGSFNQVRMESAFGGPLSDAVRGRISFYFNRHDPILKNEFPVGLRAGLVGSGSGHSDLWNDNEGAVRGQLEFDLSSRTNLLVSAYASEKIVSSANWQQLATTAVVNAAGQQVGAQLASSDPLGCMSILASTGACIGGTRPRVGGDFSGYVAPGPGALKTSQDYASLDSNQYKTQGITAKLTSDLGGASLTSVTHYMHSTKRQAQDVDESPDPQTIVMNNSHNDTFSQELRLNGGADRIHWVSGLYFLDMLTVYNQGLADEAGNGAGQDRIFGEAPGAPSLEGDFRAQLRTKSTSGFGQIDFALTEKWSVVAGGRLINERKSYDYSSFLFVNTNDTIVENQGTPVATFLPPFSANVSENLWAGKLQLEYRPLTGVLLYGGLNRGVKAGSFNAPLLTTLTPAEYSYKPEKLTSYEAGFKSTVLDGKARINGSVYYYDYKDYQAFLFQGVSGAISNADATYKGLELEVQASPVKDLTLMLSGAYTDATIPNLAVGPGVTRDVTPAFTPKEKVTGLLRYLTPVVLGDGQLAAQVDATYTSSFFQNIQNYRSLQADPYLISNLRLSWSRQTTATGNWDVSLFVNNLTNVRNKTTAVDLSGLCGCTEQAYGDPRWVGIQVRVSH
jgi:iron complex outermembrane receptor protein